jgi:transposase
MRAAIPMRWRASLGRLDHSIRTWVAKASQKEGRHEAGAAGLGGPERDDLVQRRRENKQLRLERDILSKAAAWFAR